MTDPDLRLPAEWEPSEYIMLSWPHAGTDWAYMLDRVQACFLDIVGAITPRAKVIIVAPDPEEVRAALEVRGMRCKVRGRGEARGTKYEVRSCRVIEAQTNDTWARDFGMICTESGDGRRQINDFKFNGWGLKFAACHDNLINRAVLSQMPPAPGAEYRNRLNFVLEGGSIESDGCGTLLTTSNCLLSPNRNGEFTKEEIEERLRGFFGCERILWLDHGDLEGDDTDSHIDTLARLLPGGVIACTTCDRPDDSHYECLGLMRRQIAELCQANGEPYKVVELPIPEAIYDEEGERLPATYANFLIVNGAVLLPVYADEHYDAVAIEAMRRAMTDYEIVPIDCRALIHQHGSLHCMTMQIPEGIFGK